MKRGLRLLKTRLAQKVEGVVATRGIEDPADPGGEGILVEGGTVVRGRHNQMTAWGRECGGGR